MLPAQSLVSSRRQGQTAACSACSRLARGQENLTELSGHAQHRLHRGRACRCVSAGAPGGRRGRPRLQPPREEAPSVACVPVSSERVRSRGQALVWASGAGTQEAQSIPAWVLYSSSKHPRRKCKWSFFFVFVFVFLFNHSVKNTSVNSNIFPFGNLPTGIPTHLFFLNFKFLKKLYTNRLTLI